MIDAPCGEAARLDADTAALFADAMWAAAAYRGARHRGAGMAELRSAREVLIGALMELVDVVPASEIPISDDQLQEVTR